MRRPRVGVPAVLAAGTAFLSLIVAGSPAAAGDVRAAGAVSVPANATSDANSPISRAPYEAAILQEGAPFAFVGVNVVPMDAERVMMRQTVLIQGDRIMGIGPADTSPLPTGTIRIEAHGKYLIPGLVDMHSHLLSDDRIDDDYAEKELAVIVANGVTTIRNPIGKPELLEYRERIEKGELLGPTLHVGSPQLAAREFGRVFNGVAVTTPAAARRVVRGFADDGYDFIKLTFGITPEVYEAVTLTARQFQIRVMGHVGPEVGLLRALQAKQQIEHLDEYLESIMRLDSGVTESLSGAGVWTPDRWRTLEHVDESRLAGVVRMTVEEEVWNTPTLAFLNTAFGTGRTDAEIESSPDYRFVSPSVREELLSGRARFWSDPPPEHLRQRYVELRNKITLELHRAGGWLLAGSDSPEWLMLYGFTLHRELESLVKAGLPPYEALRAATRNPAIFLSRPGSGRIEYARVEKDAIVFATAMTGEVDFGTVAPGKRADLVLLSANPLDYISNTRRIEGVVVRGRWLPRGELDAMLDDSAAVLSKAPLRER